MVPRHPIDEHVGGRVRLRRIQASMSREELAEWLGVTPELMHRYESGAEPIGASTLYEISKSLKVTPSYFFRDLKAVFAPLEGIDQD
jgi:transcriptional regulator with XRE-family HTH domain